MTSDDWIVRHSVGTTKSSVGYQCMHECGWGIGHSDGQGSVRCYGVGYGVERCCMPMPRYDNVGYGDGVGYGKGSPLCWGYGKGSLWR